MRFLPVLFLLFFLFMSACSSNSAVTPQDNPIPSRDNIAQDWGNYTLSFDPQTSDVKIEYDRDVSIHYEVTSFLAPPACGGGGCITATLNSWNPVTYIASFSVAITNPSAWTPSDVRMIFYGLGTKEIANADSYTRSFVGTIEP
ncbi:hypothetical protein KKB99_06225, partial [bacterium]|nr:hypothetical protein [bacterium]MBU1025584.1 hypothetical protein [bacterium]